eukprot:scaffold57570_cov26-Tisochrysis_lutea.AAC.1
MVAHSPRSGLGRVAWVAVGTGLRVCRGAGQVWSRPHMPLAVAPHLHPTHLTLMMLTGSKECGVWFSKLVFEQLVSRTLRGRPPRVGRETARGGLEDESAAADDARGGHQRDGRGA